jgi:hypothetical protein
MRYDLKSPGPAAYRLQLFLENGEDFAEVLLAGTDDRASVEVRPGLYAGRITEIGLSDDPGAQILLRLGAEGGQIQLAEQYENARRRPERSVSGRRLPIPVPTTERISQVGREQVRMRFEPAPLRGGSDGDDGRLGAWSRIRGLRRDAEGRAPIYEDRREGAAFEVALSEDVTPGQLGSWRRPELLNVRCHGADGGSILIVVAADARQRDLKSRVRLSVAVEGLPTIRVPVPSYDAELQIKVSPVRSAQKMDLRVEMVAARPEVQALVAALWELDRNEALKIVEWNGRGLTHAVDTLAAKRSDLWAATAAALVLVRTRSLQGYASWAQNLARLAPHISDAAVVAAWAAAVSGRSTEREIERECMRHLTSADAIGANTFSAANTLQLELLNVLRGTAHDTEVRQRAAAAYAKLAARTGHRLSAGPYLIWEQTGSRLQQGRLAGFRYASMARGQVTRNGFVIDHLANPA